MNDSESELLENEAKSKETNIIMHVAIVGFHHKVRNSLLLAPLIYICIFPLFIC